MSILARAYSSARRRKRARACSCHKIRVVTPAMMKRAVLMPLIPAFRLFDEKYLLVTPSGNCQNIVGIVAQQEANDGEAQKAEPKAKKAIVKHMFKTCKETPLSVREGQEEEILGCIRP